MLFYMVLLFISISSSFEVTYPCNPSDTCGCSRSPASLARIVGGETASSGTWGWIVSISIANNYLCGGSIISSSWVITAAHCVNGFRASQVTIYAGSTVKYTSTQIRVASQIIVHSSFTLSTYENDIALLQLGSPLNMSDPYVSSICLPTINSTILSTTEWPTANTTVVAIGWGLLNESGSLPTNLQQVTLQTVYYGTATCYPLVTNWHTQLCAGVNGGGKGVCNGDSGGPLMMFSSRNQWVLIGLISYGIGCAEATSSAVYTRVAAFQSWISSNTNVSLPNVYSSTYSVTSASTRVTISRSTTNYTNSTTAISSHAEQDIIFISTIFILVKFYIFE